MQLGELQHQYPRFVRRDATIMALSVDPADESLGMIERLGLAFAVGSDPNQRIIQQFRVQNPDTRELALHAVYVLNEQAEVIYRKVGLRRPQSAELIDAIDAYYGNYPQHDNVSKVADRIAVAYPQNNFQALLEVARVEAPPSSIDQALLAETMRLITNGRSDDAVFAFRRLIAASPEATDLELYATTAWMTRQRFFSTNPDAITTGKELQRRLARLSELEAAVRDNRDKSQSTSLYTALGQARAGLSATRAKVSREAAAWNLRYAKTMIRSYRELARAARSPTPT